MLFVTFFFFCFGPKPENGNHYLCFSWDCTPQYIICLSILLYFIIINVLICFKIISVLHSINCDKIYYLWKPILAYPTSANQHLTYKNLNNIGYGFIFALCDSNQELVINSCIKTPKYLNKFWVFNFLAFRKPNERNVHAEK